MSSDLAIRVENLGKRYRIGATQGIGRYRSLREDVTKLASVRGRKQERATRDFWALKEVSFEIKAGDTVGIIGRNGAGKSTLLKILARITPPTSGKGQTVGRVGSLLEVGTGFHPELTGRENVLLAAAIIGMTRGEVQRRFDDIVEFAGLVKFLDTPVKRYSSGMYMRLAFSVAAHLEPEILLVDEVLAVGDAEFQKKCLGKMEDISGTGRTVVFVSHSMPSVLRLCPRVILLDAGRVAADGNGTTVVEEYMGRDGSAAERTWADNGGAPGDAIARLKSVRVIGANGTPAPRVGIQDAVGVEVEYWFLGNETTPRVNVYVDVCNEDGIELFVTQDANNQQWRRRRREPGLVRSTCWLPGHLLAEGTHTVHVTLGSTNPRVTHAHERDAVAFQVTDDTNGDGVRADWPNEWPGVMRPMLEWTVETENAVPPRAP